MRQSAPFCLVVGWVEDDVTDEQLAQYLGIPESIAHIVCRDMDVVRRRTYGRMAQLETEIELWRQGLGPKPKGVLVDAARTPARAKGMVQRLKSRWRK